MMTAIPSTATSHHATAEKRPTGWPGALNWIMLGLATLVGVLMVSPFLLVIINAMKTDRDYAAHGPLALPEKISFEAWGRFIERSDYFQLLWNSVIIAALAAVVGVVIAFAAAYALGVGRIRGNTIIVAVLLLATMVPQEATIYPLYYGAQALGLRNTIWPVVIILGTLHAAFGAYLLSSVMGTFPTALLEAARLDGASMWQILWRVVFPVMRPTLAVLLVLFFIATWNEFYIPLIMLTDPGSQTLPIALASLRSQFNLDVTGLAAGSLLSLIPTLLFFLFFQRTLMRGIAVGAVK
jgi:raffinose/stachyose/melibiose transport system permease protein